MNTNISVQSMIRNEIDLLPRYSRFVKTFAEEWCILDGGSTDGSIEYLERFKELNPDISIRMVSDSKYDLKECKNFNFLLQESLKMCTRDWIWLGYIDEFVPILSFCVKRLTKEKRVYSFPRYSLFSLRPIKYRRIDNFARLFPREGLQWVGGPIHSEVYLSPFPNVLVDIPILHVQEAMRIEHIREKEERFEACGPSVLTSSYSAEIREKYTGETFEPDLLWEYFLTEKTNPILNPYRILANKENIEVILKGLIPFPSMVEFFLSRICNHKCIGCLFEDYRSLEFLPRAEIVNVLTEIRQYVKNIEFCGGGEPTLHPDFLEIIQDAYCMGFRQGLFTNGSMLWKHYKPIVRYLIFVRVSLDASNKEIHSSIHHSDDFELIIDGIKKSIEEKYVIHSPINIGLKMLVQEENKDDIEDFVNLGLKLGVDNIQLKAARNSPSSLKIDELVKYNNVVNELKNKYPNFVFGSLLPSSLEGKCYANLLASFIDSNGDVMICCYYQGREKTHKIGNIKERSFREIWFSTEHLKAINNINTDLCQAWDCRFHEYNRILKQYKTNPVYA